MDFVNLDFVNKSGRKIFEFLKEEDFDGSQ